MEILNKGRAVQERPDKGDIILIAPNGADLPIKYHPHDTVGKTLDHGIKEFSKRGDIDISQEYILVFGDTPLENTLRLEDARIKPGDKLKIRAKRRPVDGDALRT